MARTPDGRTVKVLPSRMTGDPVVDFIKRQEGYVPEPYVDVSGLSVGYGHLLTPQERNQGTFSNRLLSEPEADELLRKDIKAHQDPWMSRLKVPITDAQKVALTSFAFNVGAGGGKTGKGGIFGIVDLINQGNIGGAADKLLEFNKVKNPATQQYETHAGLSERRRTEREIFLSDSPPTSKPSPALSQEGATPASRGRLSAITSGVNQGIQHQGYTGTPEQMLSDNQRVLSSMIELSTKISASVSTISEQEYFDRIRAEGRGA